MSIEMDTTCQVLSCGYNLLTDKTREVVLCGSWSLAIRVLLTSPRAALACGSRDIHAMSLHHLFRVFSPACCSVGLAIELDDLRSINQLVQHRHHDLRIADDRRELTVNGLLKFDRIYTTGFAAEDLRGMIAKKRTIARAPEARTIAS